MCSRNLNPKTYFEKGILEVFFLSTPFLFKVIFVILERYFRYFTKTFLLF